MVACRRCPRLVAYLDEVSRVRRRAFAGETYWGRPLAGFGDPAARLLIVGLAPAAHGGNRTGRVFTGDSSATWLHRALHRAAFARLADSVRADDGQELFDAWVTLAARCAPPGNKPTPGELCACRPFLARELEILTPRVTVALGRIAWDAVLAAAADLGAPALRPRPAFAHLAETQLPLRGRTPLLLLGSYHPSRQNTNTGRLTEAMLDAVFERARAALAL